MRTAAIVPFLACAALISGPLAADEPRKRSRDDVEQSSDPQDKMICKRFAEAGSLIAMRKECHTRREWDRIRADLRAEAATGSGSCNSPACN